MSLFKLIGWGIGLAFHIWAVYTPSERDEQRIQQEIKRIRRH